jgi:hypothetical protein
MLQTISFETDMEDGVKMQRLGRLFASGDKAAHTFKIKVKGADLSGYSADGYMIRATNDTVPISAIVDGDIVIATLPEACYIVPGSFSLIFCVKNENERTAVFWSVGTITRSRTETIIDTEKRIPSLDELLAQLDALKTATSEAQKAAAAANGAYQRADAATEQATASAASANAAAQRADTAAKGWENDKASDSAKLNGKAPEYYIRARNLLDNSNFLNPINQRGKSVYESGFGMAIDRWYLGHSAASSGGKASLTIYKGGISIRNTTGEAQSYAYIQTRVAKEEVVNGKAYTFAYRRNDEIVLLTLSSEHVANDIEQYGFFPLSIENKNINEANIEWAALYEGIYTAETLPPYTPKGYAVEMAECKRYYEKLSPNAMLKTTVHADFYELLIQYIEKRIDKPTVTYVGNNIAGIDNIGKSSCRFYSNVMSGNYVSTVEITADL